MTKTELIDFIKSDFGYPYVKVELGTTHLNNIIFRAKAMWDKHATGRSTQEVFLTKVISGGERNYTMPDGILDVIDMNDSSDDLGSANQLFTVQNALANSGMLPSVGNNVGCGSWSLLDYHTGLSYLDDLSKYTVSSFNWTYHQFNNTLMLSPVPSASSNWSNSNVNYMLVRAYIREGYEIDGTDNSSEYNQFLYDDPWFQEYCIALAKIVLGNIRRKFANGEILGNSTISLDGDSLVQEGREDKITLEEQLKDQECGEGYGIMIG